MTLPPADRPPPGGLPADVRPRARDAGADVEALHDDGRWYRGTLLGWARVPGGPWRATVEYSAPSDAGGGTWSAWCRTVPADRVRPDPRG